MPQYTATIGVRRSRGSTGGRLLVSAAMAGGLALACAPMAYMLWPQARPIAPDAPSLPITVAGVVFNVPPAAIRVKMQRRAGAQARIDLTFQWPSLEPPDGRIKPSPTSTPSVTDRLFVTIAGSDGTLPPLERLKVIYPRYVEKVATVGANGLRVQGFRAGTPYQGEDLIYDPKEPARFLLRCTRALGATPGMCLHERRVGAADLTIRFPLEWLEDWRAVADGIDRLIASFRSTGG